MLLTLLPLSVMAAERVTCFGVTISDTVPNEKAGMGTGETYLLGSFGFVQWNCTANAFDYVIPDNATFTLKSARSQIVTFLYRNFAE